MPVEIEVKNYRNYRDELFSYDGISFATINGENGAGKSSLFMDAMLDALLRSPGRATSLAGFATTRMPAAAPSSLHSTSATSCTALPAPAQERQGDVESL